MVAGAPVYIAVLGLVGTGKSTFINQVIEKKQEEEKVPIGTGLFDYTSAVKSYECMRNGRPVVLIDTPGFDSATRSDLEVLADISAALSQYYTTGIQLDGLIYLHRVSDPRMTGAAARSLRVLRKLCGESNLGAVALVTTFWNQDDTETEIAHDKELRSVWADLVARGSRCMMYDDGRGSALHIVDYLVGRDTKVVLDIQTEVVDRGLSVEETSAGMELAGEKQKYKAEIQGLKDQLHDREVECDDWKRKGQETEGRVEELQTALGLAQDGLRAAEAGRRLAELSTADKERRIQDLQSQLELAKQQQTGTMNELNKLKAELAREKDMRPPLRYDPALNVLDSRGEFPLYRAAAGGHYAETKSLLERGANPRLRTSFQWTALHWAVHNDHYSVAKLLLDYGASPTAESDTKATPVSMAKTGMMRQLLQQYEQ